MYVSSWGSQEDVRTSASLHKAQLRVSGVLISTTAYSECDFRVTDVSMACIKSKPLQIDIYM